MGEIIRELREEKGWSQKTLAQQADSTQAIVSYLECGKHNFHYDTLVRIADALDYDLAISFLVRGEEQSSEQSEWDLAFADALESFAQKEEA